MIRGDSHVNINFVEKMDLNYTHNNISFGLIRILIPLSSGIYCLFSFGVTVIVFDVTSYKMNVAHILLGRPRLFD